MTQHTQTAFLQDDAGAVTVDWVVLTAALVGLGLAVMSVVSGGVEDLSNDIDTELRGGEIIKTAFDPAPVDPLTFEFLYEAPNVTCDNGTTGLPDTSQSVSSQGCQLNYIISFYDTEDADGTRYRIYAYDNYTDNAYSDTTYLYHRMEGNFLYPYNNPDDIPQEVTALETEHEVFDPLDRFPAGL